MADIFCLINNMACVRNYLKDLGGRHKKAKGRGQAGREDASRDEIIEAGHLTQNLCGVRRGCQPTQQLLTRSSHSLHEHMHSILNW